MATQKGRQSTTLEQFKNIGIVYKTKYVTLCNRIISDNGSDAHRSPYLYRVEHLLLRCDNVGP